MNSSTIALMHRLRAQRRWISWMGVMLVLMSLLAPTVSHAVRNAQGATPALSALNAWCIPLALLQATDPASDSGSSDRHEAPASEHACGYCVSAVLNIGVAAAPTPTTLPAADSVAPVPRRETRGQGVEPPQSYLSRAPPLSA